MEDAIVVGGGTMGAGIAFVAARAGFGVTLVEPDAASQNRARDRIGDAAERSGDRDAAQCIRIVNAIGSEHSATLAIEAVPERLNLKRDVFAGLARALGPDALLATNTSSLSVTAIAQGIERPDRVLGLHFFNPPTAMRLVEIVRAAQTSERTLARASEIVTRLGKTGILTADTPGFVVNRVARPYYLQALRALQAGAAGVEAIDRLARGCGFPMGPFELMDFIGLDVNFATSQSLYERTGEGRFEPVSLQEHLIAQGRLGRKAGRGFYRYPDQAPTRDEPMHVPEEVDADERVAVIGTSALSGELHDRLAQRFAAVQAIENDDLLDELSADTTIVVDGGDGSSDRSAIVAHLDAALGGDVALLCDAYATDLAAACRRLRHPERVVGFGIVGSLEAQQAIEIVERDGTSDEMLDLADDVFERIGRRTVRVKDVAGMVLGRTIGSIVDEAVRVVEEGTADAADVDLAMRLGTKYPEGPLAWGRAIGGARVTRILQRLAAAEGAAFAPHRALWVLDRLDESSPPDEATGSTAIYGVSL